MSFSKHNLFLGSTHPSLSSFWSIIMMSIVFSTSAAATKLFPPTTYRLQSQTSRSWRLKSSTSSKNSLKSEEQLYSRVGALSTGPVQPAILLQVATTAAQTGAKVSFIFFIFLTTLFKSSCINGVICDVLYHSLISQFYRFVLFQFNVHCIFFLFKLCFDI